MLVVDGHLDLAWNALGLRRDLTLSAHTLRAQEHSTFGPGRAQNTVAWPELRRGRVAVCFGTLMARTSQSLADSTAYPTAVQAFGTARGHLAYYRGLERLGLARVLTDAPALDAHLRAWLAWEADAAPDPAAAPPLGVVISMESADPLLEPEEVAEWRAAGVRVIGPAHYGVGRYAGGTGVEQGLTDLGRALLVEMQAQGVILDMTHLSDQAFWQAAERFEGPVMASHSNCRALVPHQRQLSDDQLRWLIERGGVIGTVIDAWMLVPGFQIGQPVGELSLEQVVDHIEHVCQLAGDTRHAAIGSDLDGGFGREECPREFDTIADLQKLPEVLARRGFDSDDIENILHANWARLLHRAWAGEA